VNKSWLTKLTVAILILGLIIVAGCGGSKETAKKDDYPKDPISVIVGFAPGGGTDIGARALIPLVEKELGVPMPVINKAGGGGWVGWSEVLKGKADGYTITYINTPGLMAGYLNPTLNNDKSLKDFDVIANHVIDYGVIAIRANETRFKDIKELIEYAKSHEVTGVSTGVANDEHILMLRLNKALGTKFVAVHTKGAGEGKASFMGGHIDIYVGNVGDVFIEHKAGEFKAVAVAAPQRSKLLPDVPTLDEMGYKGIYSWASRGIAAKKGIPKERLEKLVAAFEKAINNPEHIKKMEEMGLEVKFMKGKEYEDFLKSDEQQVLSVFDLLGWDKK